MLCFKGNAVLMNIPIPQEIISCNNTALLPKDTALQRVHILLSNTYTLHVRSNTPPHTHTPVQVDYLSISIKMCTFNLPFSAQVHSDATLPAWLSLRIIF